MSNNESLHKQFGSTHDTIEECWHGVEKQTTEKMDITSAERRKKQKRIEIAEILFRNTKNWVF